MEALERVVRGEHAGAVAIDPGGTSGFAYIRSRDHELSDIHYEMVSKDKTTDTLRSILKLGTIDYVVVEKHIPRIGVTMGREARETMELVGSCTAVAEQYGVEVVWHTASQMKTVPWCNLGRGVHAKDACKHLARFLLDNAGTRGLLKVKKC